MPNRNQHTAAVDFSDEDRGAPTLPKVKPEEPGALLARIMDSSDILTKRMGALEE